MKKLRMKGNSGINILRILSMVLIVSGAIGSVGYTLHAGSRNQSILLVLLFVIWVLSPFVALMISNLVSLRWTVPARIILFVLILVLTFGSFLFYGRILVLAGTRPAFVFLVVPFISWLLIAAFNSIVRIRLNKISRQ